MADSLSVAVLSPVSGSTVAGQVAIRAEITGSKKVARVEFMIDGLLVYTDKEVPWEYLWDTKGFHDENQHSIFVKAYDYAGTSYGSSSLVQISSVVGPQAFFTIKPEYGDTETIFSFSASESFEDEEDNDNLKVRWDWENDGRWDTRYSRNRTIERQFSSAGIHTIRMEVRDRVGLVNEWKIPLIVKRKNTSPIALFTINPGSGNTETIFHFDATGSKDNEDDYEQLKVRWDWENDAVWDTEYERDKTIKHQFQNPGTYTVKMELQDSGNLLNYWTNQIIVKSVIVKSQKLTKAKLIVLDNLILIPGGTFKMGNSDRGKAKEYPRHSVKLDSFYLSPFEVSHQEYIKFLNSVGVSPQGSFKGHELVDMGGQDCAIKYKHGFYFVGSTKANSMNCPIMEVTWWGAVEYCNWLSREAGLQPVYYFGADEEIRCNWTANGYRLPTEAEWEFAARSGGREDRKWSGTNVENEVQNFAWFLVNSRSQTQPIGTKQPNDLGLYDMTGNVWEWCWDQGGNYDHESQTNPKGGLSSGYRVLRGGSWNYQSNHLCCSNRGFGTPTDSYNNLGFRISRRR